MTDPKRWHDSSENITALLEWLHSEGLLADAVGEHDMNSILYYLQKPWKWNAEWHDFLKKHPNWKA